MIRLPRELCEHGFVFLSSVLHAHVGELFGSMHVLGCYQFRVTRNSDLFVDEEEVKDCAPRSGANCSSATSATRCAWRSPTTAPRRWPAS